ncbi:MAG: hypothetical protein LUD72_09880 [Bacteroidales bacterium]|nr:hypothetical protein [Bacteroidales bacterium]
MKTFILKWNPGFSNFKMEDFINLADGLYGGLSWSIWEHEAVEVGDRFYMLRVGEGETGIVMSGRIATLPNSGEDWSGKGRLTYYSGLDIEYISSHGDAIVHTAKLIELFPGFEWTRGHSGVVLPHDIATKLNAYWDKLVANEDIPYLYRL